MCSIFNYFQLSHLIVIDTLVVYYFIYNERGGNAQKRSFFVNIFTKELISFNRIIIKSCVFKG